MTTIRQNKKELFAEIYDINFDKVDDCFGKELLRISGVPIDIKYAKKLESLGICQIKWYEGIWNWEYMKPMEIIEVGTVL